MIQIATSVDQNVALDFRSTPQRQIFETNLPLPFLLQPLRTGDLVEYSDVLGEVVLLAKVVVILLDLRGKGIGIGPVMLWLESQCVVVCGDSTSVT